MKLVIGLLLMTSVASAHLVEGVHAGKTAAGAACQIEVKATTYEGIKHPLNERIQVVVEGHGFAIHHPAVIDVPKNTVAYDHDFFQGWVGTPTGGLFVKLEPDFTVSPHGVKNFSMTMHDYKNPALSSTVVCTIE